MAVDHLIVPSNDILGSGERPQQDVARACEAPVRPHLLLKGSADSERVQSFLPTEKRFFTSVGQMYSATPDEV